MLSSSVVSVWLVEGERIVWRGAGRRLLLLSMLDIIWRLDRLLFVAMSHGDDDVGDNGVGVGGILIGGKNPSTFSVLTMSNMAIVVKKGNGDCRTTM